MKKVALVTYNRIGDGQFANGVMRHNGSEIYIAQNGHRTEWAAEPNQGTTESRRETRKMMAQITARQVDLSHMDHTYIYVGTRGGEEAIKETRGLDSHKVTYVLCGCNYGAKMDLIKRIGNGGADMIPSECGGQQTLHLILGTLLGEDIPKEAYERKGISKSQILGVKTLHRR